jgi:potassium-dependent mechanosensitive channel
MSPRFSLRLVLAALLLGSCLAPLPRLAAQTTTPGGATPAAPAAAPVPAPAAAQPPPAAPQPSAAVSAQRGKLDAVRMQLDELEAGVGRRNGSDSALLTLRGQIDPMAETARGIVGELAPRGESLRLRLKELGPKPDEKSAPETPDVIREREEKQAQLNEIDETVRLARALLVQAEQIDKEIADKRRELFTNRLFESSGSMISPQLWMEVGRTLPQEVNAISGVARTTSQQVVNQLSAEGAAVFGGGIVVALLLMLPVRRFSMGLVKRDRLAGQPSRLQLTRAAAMIAFFSAVAPMLAAFILTQIVRGLDLLPQRVEPVFATLVGGVAFIAFVQGLAEGLLAPERMNWRLFDISDDRAATLLRIATTIAVLLVASRTLEALYTAVAANLRLTVATKGVFAIAVALAIARGLNLIRSVDECDEAAFGPHVSDTPDLTGPIRIVGWTLISVVVIAAVLGYVAFSSFLADQIAWAGILLPTLVLLLMLVDELITASFAPGGRMARIIAASIGLSRNSQEQIGVLLSGGTRLAMLGFAMMLLLAPWGVESGDILSALRVGIFGFTVGGVTLSFWTVIVAISMFIIGMVVTRTLQGWLQRRYLPHTHLDAGLKSSITTGLGYIGIIVTAVISTSYLGIGFERLTLVAGALSVGIGLGLQSIVNNFVSGLIILAERAVRVGDLVVVGDEQGYVRKINVRATQIETFDRATLIVPNSSLVTNTVKNWVHTDRMARVVITVPIPRDTDADALAQLLRDVAGAHPDVLEDPAPRVLFKKIADSSLTFDLICFVGEVDVSARVSSDLTFAVFRQLRAKKIIAPAGPPTMEIAGMVELREQVKVLQQALVGRSDGAAMVPENKGPMP